MTATYILYQSIYDADGEPQQDGSHRWDCTGLRDAVKDLTTTRTAHVDGVEYIIARYTAWSGTLLITVQNGTEFRTGCREERVLAVIGINRATAHRLSRLLNAEWGA